jgi:hypothetical protein
MKVLILISVLLGITQSLPQGDKNSGPSPVVYIPTAPQPSGKPVVLPGFDIKFSEEQLRSGIIGENYRWRNGFFVQMDPAFNENERAIINNALYEIHTKICIDVLIWPSDSQPSGDYVFIKRGDSNTGCWSYVGRLGGRQELNLQYNGCVDHGVTMHEAIHALGFFHEQSRPDRDEFVEILWGNITPEYQYAFDKYGWDHVSTFDVPYDYISIMHYNSHDFSHNGQVTIRAWNGSPVGNRGYLTDHDLSKLRRMYNC